MKQIIEEVLQAESAAAGRLKAAREKAARMVKEAEAASLEKVNQAKQQCQQQMQAAIEEARRAAEAVRAKMVQEAQGQTQNILRNDPGRVDRLVQAICDKIMNNE